MKRFNLFIFIGLAMLSSLSFAQTKLKSSVVDERFTWYNPTYATDRVLLPSYSIFDAALYYKPDNSGIQLTLKANNLFDKTYWLGGLNPSRLGPGAPRNVLLNATYRF